MADEEKTRCGFNPPSQREFSAYYPKGTGALVVPAAPAALVFHGDHAQQAQELYARLPVNAKRVVCLGLELPEDGVFNKRILKDRWLGYYDWRARAFGLEWSPLTFVHEFFHHVQIYALSIEQWRDWEAFWRANRARFPDRGRQSASEGWAEGAAYLYVRGEGAIHPTVSEKIRAILEAH